VGKRIRARKGCGSFSEKKNVEQGEYGKGRVELETNKKGEASARVAEKRGGEKSGEKKSLCVTSRKASWKKQKLTQLKKRTLSQGEMEDV